MKPPPPPRKKGGQIPECLMYLVCKCLFEVTS